MKTIILIYLFSISQIIFPQNIFRAKIKDEKTKEPLIGVNVFLRKLKLGSVTDTNGFVEINNIPSGKYDLIFSYIGYKTLQINISFPLTDKIFIQDIYLEQKNVELPQVTISSTRTENRIDNTPIRVEVLGLDEVNEEIGIKPGNISKLLGETSGVQVQQTSASSGNVTFRIQGLPGKYTQLLKDGFPLYSGFSSGLSLLQIPPLDLQQVEIIKGPSSTLYGGDAIAGIINLISKVPRKKHELSLLINQTQKGESDFSGYYSARKNNIGITLLADYNFQKPVDVNNDGFTDIPKFNQMNFEPKFYFQLNSSTNLSAGLSYSYDNREGGDLIAIQNSPDSLHRYINKNKSKRISSVFELTKTFENGNVVNFKNSTNSFSLDIQVPSSYFSGNQFSTYSELSYLIKNKINRLVLGLNINTDNFKQKSFSTSSNLNYYNYSLGAFALDEWNILDNLTLQAGMRTDYQNRYNTFLLPQAFLLYKFGKDFYLRFGGGLGYKIPTVFTDEAEERAYLNVLPISNNAKAEKSIGSSVDFNYQAVLWDEINFSFDQAFYYTRVTNPLLANEDSLAAGKLFYYNSSSNLDAKGFDTNLHFTLDDFEFFMDYTFTDAELISSDGHSYLELTPKHKLNITATIEDEDNWRTGLEAFYTGHQYLSNGSESPDYWTIGLMVEKYFDHFSIIANVENLFDVRQTKFENIVIPPYTNPTFKQIYAPLDGMVANAAIKISL